MRFVCGVFLLLTLPAPARTAVVTDFNKCPDFFFPDNNKILTPTIFTEVNLQTHYDRYQKICQQREPRGLGQNPKYEFATLYDTVNKIPVFSAYRVRGTTTTGRNPNWYIEPQLDNKEDSPFQGTEKNNRPKNANVVVGTRQALQKDYEQSGYDKGHLFPVSHADTQATADATFTLTNTVPQDRCLNEILWRDMERKIMDHFKLNVGQQQGSPVAYVVTGAVPGISNINNKVNVPGYLWTAFCYHNTNQWVSKAHYAPNDSSQLVVELSVKKLESFLSGSDGYNQLFSIFQGKCNSNIDDYIYDHDIIIN